MLKRSSLIAFLIIAVIVVTGLITIHVRAAGALSPKEARQLIAHMAGIQLPSDAVRIKEVSGMGNSTVVTAQVETAFRFVKGDNDKWRIAEIRTGDRRWEDVDTLMKALNTEKAALAHAELETIATALESYRREHGSYPQLKNEAALVDRLNPRYLPRIIRVDPWHQPYSYEGTSASFVLRSSGADGKPNTSDDVTLTR
jgi:Type II secretion system (T2SS), protein G